MTNSATISEIGQIAIVVSDMVKAKWFYGEVLGLVRLFDAGPNLSFFAAGSVRLMLTLREPEGEPARNSILYFKTAPVENMYRTVLERGAVAEHGPQLTARMPDYELWIAFVRDPDGNLIGLMEERR